MNLLNDPDVRALNEKFRQKADLLIDKEISNVVNETTRNKAIESILKIRKGEGRDFFV